MREFKERKIIQVVDNFKEACADTSISYTVSVVLECGHKNSMNPIFTYRVGERQKCFKCGADKQKEGLA